MPFPSPGDLPDPGIEPRSPALQADALTSEPLGKPLDKVLSPYEGAAAAAAAAAAESLQSFPTFSDPMVCSSSGSSVHGILQARVLEWGCHCLLQ